MTTEHAFDGQLVGGKDLFGRNPIEAGIREIVRDEIGDIDVDRIMAETRPIIDRLFGKNGNGGAR